jgi:hypothetical protein
MICPKVRGVGVRASEFDELAVVVLHTLNPCPIAIFDEIGRFSRGGGHVLVSFFGFGRSFFRNLGECVRGVLL